MANQGHGDDYLRGGTIRELILIIVNGAGGPITTAEVINQIRSTKSPLEAGDNSIRSELSLMASPKVDLIHRISKGVYIEASQRPRDWEQQRVTDALSEFLADLREESEGYPKEPPGYESSALALIDAVFSSHAHDHSVIRVVDRIKHLLQREDSPGFTIAELLDCINCNVPSELTATDREHALVELFGNGSRVASTKELKVEVVIRLGRRLVGEDTMPMAIRLNSREDFLRLSAQPLEYRTRAFLEIERAITDRLTGIVGVGPATVRYLFLLMGLDVVKPDRMLIRWVQQALGGDVRAPSPQRCAELIETATRLLQESNKAPSIRAVDHLIWRYQSGRLAGARRIGGEYSAEDSSHSSPFDVGSAVDWNPSSRLRRATERWHGTVTRALGGSHVEVEWTMTDSLRDFRSGSRLPLQLPFRERIQSADVVLCDPAAPGNLHPAEPAADAPIVGRNIYWGLTQKDQPTWKGEIVGFVNASRDRAIVRWDRIVDMPASTGLSAEDVSPAKPIYRVELLKNLKRKEGGSNLAMNPYLGLFDEKADGSPAR